MNENRSGLVLIDKPVGVTSFKALSSVKKALKNKKAGHAGTLDKFASGLLIVAIGGYTRLISVFEGLEKEYEGTICFGKTTATLDPEGAFEGDAPLPSLSVLESVLPLFQGEIDQVPPVFSAIHVDGKRAYQRRLAGEDVKMKPRKVTIHEIRLIEWDEPFLSIRVKCSKGTYIRALARDIGEACGSLAYLSSLRRTGIGKFSVSDAVSPEKFDPRKDLCNPEGMLKNIPHIGIRYMKEETVLKIRNGVPFQDSWISPAPEEDVTGLLDEDGGLLALIERKDGRWKYRMVIPGGFR